MNKIDYGLYKKQFDTLFAQLPFEARESRMMIINTLRAKLDLWCRKYYKTVYNPKEYGAFQKDMTACFNRALDEIIE